MSRTAFSSSNSNSSLVHLARDLVADSDLADSVLSDSVLADSVLADFALADSDLTDFAIAEMRAEGLDISYKSVADALKKVGALPLSEVAPPPPGHAAKSTNFAPPIRNLDSISHAVNQCFLDKKESLRIEDEFSEGTIEFLVKESRAFLTCNPVTSLTWKALGTFLRKELWELTQIKQDLILTERKCALVRQKAAEISSSEESSQAKARLMACAMLLAETEMRRDHLRERIAAIIEELVGRILSDKSDLANLVALELRLRAILGSV